MLRPVVVGLDGSRESLTAADWAAREALRRGLPLRLVHAADAPAAGGSDLPELSAPRHWARRILRDAMDQINERYPRLYLSAEQIARPAAEALVSAGGAGELLVLGSRAFSGFGGFLAGSVALQTVTRVERPVVLVRADQTVEDEHTPDPEGRPSADTPYRAVVVGVDAVRPAEQVLAFAFESAALRSTPLRAVYAWRLPMVRAVAEAGAHQTEEAAARRALTAALAPWREKFPTVEVVEQAEEGHPAQRLLSAAQDAGLLAVGRPIRPARLGAHTGPVAHAVMHHVRCPVAIVPHE
ncbi:nucleotide-binding universal stress UspA family protein [Streptomyces sp. Ag109_O5-1]|uniref:universal stress protein n=1 Tax=Streptomyces sp. Ag109_O5-1 TaxID=1938851 RepID=UPI000F4E2AE9|nr:universal stress protein [Streptomyces sp. Ag109_O5-1]RPE46593.1 nucleotide-binding universal stress UspA family protein [Streptomyces sp. Ag109_O5-1]